MKKPMGTATQAGAAFPAHPQARCSSGLAQHNRTLASAGEELQKDLEEEKVLLEKVSGKTVHDALTAGKSKTDRNQTQDAAEITEEREPVDNENPAVVVAPITMGYTVGISNCGWEQPDKFVRIYITLTGGHPRPGLDMPQREHLTFW